jgi:nucleoside triphosphate pyrophosphatase
MRLILASTSPRRREILSLLGLPFDVIAPVFDEVSSPHLDIREEVLQFAAGKARSVLRNNPQSIVIGGDTMISLGGEKIGKPVDLADAKRMLRALSGRIHRIFTSVAVVEDFAGRDLNTVAEVTVKMRDLTDTIIEEYLAYNESLDKAGAYSIQSRGSELVDFIEGDYLAAVGLPLKPVAEYLKKRGVTVPLDVDRLYRDKSYLNWRRVSCQPQ